VLNVLGVCVFIVIENASAYIVLYYLWPFRLYHIPHYVKNNKNLGRKEKVLNKKYVFLFYLELCETFLILRTVQQDIVINVQGYS
jgi:hypothetical protein